MYEMFPGNYLWSYNTMLAFSAGGQIGDIELIMPDLTENDGDNEVWHYKWMELADILEQRAEGCISDRSYSETMFLACLYAIIGEHFVPPADPLRMETYDRVLQLFEAAQSKSPFILEKVSIPFEGTTLPGYFQPAKTHEDRSGTVIMICGLDTTKELWYLRARQEITNRGLNVLYIDTPGIGEALRKNNLYTRADYERPIQSIIDYLETRSDVEPSKIGIIGSSLGGYYVARAAAYESRIAATIAWGAIYDYYKVWSDRLENKGTLGAPIFQIMFVTGTDTLERAVESIKDFQVEPLGKLIKCPFLIMHGANDKQVPLNDARKMLNAIGSPNKELKIFNGMNGGSAHTQFNNHQPALNYAADWITQHLRS